MMKLFSLVVFALQAHIIFAKNATYNWSIDWVSVSPDGFTRPAVGINGQWPCPPIEVDLGDRVVINLFNNLGNETTAIHFHGLFQTNSSQMDGPAMVTQCPIPPGSNFTYDFTINQPGTYWYHSHVGGQYIDGFRGPIIVHDPAAPYQVDEEIVLTVSDWYHTEAPSLVNYFLSSTNEEVHGGSEPVPNATLINEAQNVHFPITIGKSYLFRIINMGGFASQYLQFDQHEMTVVEVDGVYTQPHRVNQLYLTPAQRYSVIVAAKHLKKQNYAITASMDCGMFDEGVIPDGLNNNVTAWLVYDPALTFPASPPMQYIDSACDDSKFVPYDRQPPLGPVTHHLTLNVNFSPNILNQNRGTFNNISYLPPQIPTLYTALSAPPSLVSNPSIYGNNTNPFILPYGAIIELTVLNHDTGSHPFHLHSHNFQLIYRSSPSPDNDNGTAGVIMPPAGYNRTIPRAPMRRDTILIYDGGSAVLRWKVDNPGISLFHCHIEWHVEAGLTMVFIEDPTGLQNLGLAIPESHRDACKAMGIGMVGNAVGRGADGEDGESVWCDLSGERDVPPEQSWGALIVAPDGEGESGFGKRDGRGRGKWIGGRNWN